MTAYTAAAGSAMPAPSDAVLDFVAALRATRGPPAPVADLGRIAAIRKAAVAEAETHCALARSHPAIAAVRRGKGQRKWLALIDGKPLADRLGRAIRYASKRAALAAASRARG